jgi:hypothetical protein
MSEFALPKPSTMDPVAMQETSAGSVAVICSISETTSGGSAMSWIKLID